MATEKNITMKQFNGTDYDILYPKTIASQIPDVYSKSETYPQSQLYTRSQLYTQSQINSMINTINTALNGKARIQTGSYVGTGTYGNSNPNTLTFDFEPQIIFIANEVYLCILFPSAKLGMLIAEMVSISNVRQIVSSDGLTVSWYVSNTESFGSSSYQMNNGLNQYIAIG